MLIEYNETIMHINTHWFTTQSYIIWFKPKIIKFQSPSLYFDDSEIPVVSHCLSFSRVNVRFDPQKIYNKCFFVLGVSFGCTRPLKKIFQNLTPGNWLINIFSKWHPPPPKFSMYRKLFIIQIRPYKCITNT